MRMAARGALFLLLLVVPSFPLAQAGNAGGSSCVTCHAQLDDKDPGPTSSWQKDVHAEAGLGCEDCHGGDPSAAVSTDAEAAMSPARGFRPAPDRLEEPEFCARCHSDAEYMKRFSPQLRVDQLAEYRTSVHGKRNAVRDPVPATCVDCHGAHGVRPTASPDSPVYATNVPETCARCHSDDSMMGPYGIPTGQLDEYRRSVHGAALLDAGDTAAPACNDCHGNHGATPPGVQSVANVCGQCHGREASLFRSSFKKELFDSMDVAECTVCHDHHRILHPTPSIFHGGSAPHVTSGRITGTDPFSADLETLEPGSTFVATWQEAIAKNLPAEDPRFLHRVEISNEGHGAVVLDATVRPGAPLPPPETLRATTGALSATLTIEPLFGLPVAPGDPIRFRLEVTASGGALSGIAVRDAPGAGVTPIEGSVCLTCHTPGDACDQASERMYAGLLSLSLELREAEQLLTEAEHKGMEVSAARFELKSKGVSAEVEARALIHSFDPERLLARAEDGTRIAGSAMDAAAAALAEIQYRRKGLAVSLVLIVLVLLGLYLKIRQLDRSREGGQDGEGVKS